MEKKKQKKTKFSTELKKNIQTDFLSNCFIDFILIIPTKGRGF